MYISKNIYVYKQKYMLNNYTYKLKLKTYLGLKHAGRVD